MSRGTLILTENDWRQKSDKIFPLESPLGNGGPGRPGPHDSLEIWVLDVLGFSIFDHLHSLEEYWSLFDLIWWKLEAPFYRVQGYQPGSPLHFRFPIL